MSVGKDKIQFKAMIDAARSTPDQSAMIPGRLVASDYEDTTPTWQAEVRRAVFDVQIDFAMILDGKHGYKAAVQCYAENHYIIFSNQRTFDTNNGDSKSMRMMMWSGNNHGGFWKNLTTFGLPVTLNFISSTIPGLMAKSQYHDLTYDCVAIYVLPKWDLEKQAFLPDMWMNKDEAPDDLEDRYALSFTLCNGKSVRAKKNTKGNLNGRGGEKGDDLQITFYEVHGNKFYRDADGKLKAQHCFLSEYDDLDQTKDVVGLDIPKADNQMRIAFKAFMEANDIACFTKPDEFDKGIEQFVEQFKLCRGVAPTSETCSLAPKYL